MRRYTHERSKMSNLEDQSSVAGKRSMPTRLFRNGNSQAVRIPKALAYEGVGVRVEIERRGDELVVRPVKQQLDGLVDAFRRLRPYVQGFERDQPTQEPRGRDVDPSRSSD